jgi:hypothetical protein
MSHTKGPWFVSTDHPQACGDYVSVVSVPSGEDVLRAAMWTDDNKAGTITAPSKADCYLIAAAPELLPIHLLEELSKSIELVRAAVRKAEGK